MHKIKYLASGFILLLQFQACITKLRRSLQIQLMLSKQHGAEVKLELTMKYLGFPIHTVVGTGMAFQLIYKGNQILSSTLTLRNI